jgi:hypothetical protein
MGWIPGFLRCVIQRGTDYDRAFFGTGQETNQGGGFLFGHFLFNDLRASCLLKQVAQSANALGLHILGKLEVLLDRGPWHAHVDDIVGNAHGGQRHKKKQAQTAFHKG